MYLQDNKETLYQWEINQKVIVENEFVKEVHFSNATTPKALVVEVKDGVADVPNILLQTDFDIKAYGYCGQSVRECLVINVIGRAKPDDYVYTETEVKSWEELANKVEETAEKAEETLAKAEEIIEGNNHITVDEKGRAAIHAISLSLIDPVDGIRDVLRLVTAEKDGMLRASDYAKYEYYSGEVFNLQGKVDLDIEPRVKTIEGQVFQLEGAVNLGLTPRVETLETQMGDIDTALDSIIAIQNSLIGGEN